MIVMRPDDRPARVGPSDWFTGQVRIEPLNDAQAPARASALQVTFEPGARTHWHTHPLGQTLIVTEGEGRIQREGGRVEVIQRGDVVWFEAGERHWHGAAPDQRMTHIAIQESLNGSAVDWAEPVSDADYAAD